MLCFSKFLVHQPLSSPSSDKNNNGRNLASYGLTVDKNS